MITRFAAAAALAVALSASTPALAEDVPPAAGSVVPDADPFYAAPPNLASYPNGQLVDHREVAVDLGTPVRAWQLSFRTNDSRDRAVLGATTVLVPTAPWTGPGARPVVSEQLPEDATGTRCAPSYTLVKNTAQSAEPVRQMLAKGWVVAVPDHEGPKSGFLTGPRTAHTILDGIRAAGRFEPAGIGPGAVWALDGYSGGGAATAWAAQLQPSYAPELAFAGAAIGGVPADLNELTARFDGSLFSGYNFGILVAYDREYPEAHLGDLFDEHGHAAIAAAGDACVNDLLANFALRRLSDHAQGTDPLQAHRLAQLLRENSLGATAPTMPVFNYHTTTDEIVPVGQADQLVAQWRAGGATIVTVRDPLGEHGLEAVHRAPDAQAFLADRLAASTTRTNG
ncbi:lipase family protein [Nocardia tengchongensis]|uniref:lipase family protein n=1 Tax=Nocardia tengchongensis TaxID=2055889 RepID=UPI00369E7281